jgi:hypothetical protein
VLDHIPPTDVEGGPGIVHGGYLGLLADELMALVACEVAGAPAMTKRLELSFRSPALTNRPLRFRAWAEEVDGRSLVVRLSATSAGRKKPCFEGRGEFVVVPTDRWIGPARAGGRSPDRVAWGQGDPSNFLRWQLQGLPHLFRAERLCQSVRLALTIEDANPGAWTISARPEGIGVTEGHEPGCDAVFRGSFREWQSVLYGSTPPDTAPLGALVAALEFKENAA